MLIGKYADGKLSFYNNEEFDPVYIKKIRIFNQNEELFLWRQNGKLKGRLRKDNEGNETTVVDAEQLLWGTRGEVLEDTGFVKLTEERGTEYNSPLRRFTEEPKNIFAHPKLY